MPQEQQRDIQQDLVMTLLNDHRTLIINDQVDDNLIESIGIPIELFNLQDEQGEAIEDDEGNVIDFTGEPIPVESRKPIRLIITTVGGELDTTMALTRIIENSKTPVHIYVQGKALSAGFYITLAGHKRYALKRSSFLVHQGESGYEGKIFDIIDYAEYMKKKMVEIKEYVCSHSNITPEQFEQMIHRETYMTAEEALSYNVIDEIL